MFPEEEARTTEHTETEEKPLPTIWRVPDELWEKVEPILAEYDPPKKTGRPRVDRRAVLDRSWTRSSSGSGRVASGTECPKSSPTTRWCIGRSSGGSSSGSWT